MIEVWILKNLQIEEEPGQTTAGLTSANQLINTTDSVSFELSNTSSDVPEPLLVDLNFPQSSKTLLPSDVFRQALVRSIRREKKVLDILAKY